VHEGLEEKPQGDKEPRRQGDRETGRQGDKETRRYPWTLLVSMSPFLLVSIQPG
jgi:hypothetical protein